MSGQWRSVVFTDLDHTLLEGPFDSAVFPQVLGELAQQTGLAFEDLLRQARAENLRRQNDPAFSPVLAMDWDDIFAGLARRLGVALRVNALEVVRACAGPPCTTLHPGAREALAGLARPGRALVAATKGLRKYQLPVLEAAGLLPFFDEVLTPDSHQSLKQSLAFYGPWPGRTRLQIMVGDTYADDVLPARRFGFKTVLRARENPDAPRSADPFARPAELPVDPAGPGDPTGPGVRPDAVILTLNELPGVVERLEREAFSV